MNRSRASAAQCRANALNAKRSTGPRTAEGKAVASGNARLHGLSSALELTVDVEDQMRAITIALTRNGATGPKAQLIAEARLLLTRVQQQKLKLLQNPQSAAGPSHPKLNETADASAWAVVEHLAALEVLWTYERKARSKLNKALKS